MDQPIVRRWAAPLLVALVTACSQAAPPAPAATAGGVAPGRAANVPDPGARPGGAARRVTVRVGFLSPNVVSVIHHIARQTGAYDATDLQVEDRPFGSGQSAAGIEALIRGDLDVYIGAGAEVARANSQAIDGGQEPPLVVVGGGTPGVTALVLGTRVQAGSLDDLKGRRLTIGVSSPSSLHLALFRGFLLEKRLTTLAERWQFIRMDASDMVPALTTGQIDGFLHSEPATSLAVKGGVGSILMASRRGDMGDKARLVPMSFVTANREWATKNPDSVTRVMTALNEAGRAYQAMPKGQAMALLGEWTRLDEDSVGRFSDWLDPRADMSSDALQAWWELIAGVMRERGEITDTLTPADVFNLSYQPSRSAGRRSSINQ